MNKRQKKKFEKKGFMKGYHNPLELAFLTPEDKSGGYKSNKVLVVYKLNGADKLAGYEFVNIGKFITTNGKSHRCIIGDVYTKKVNKLIGQFINRYLYIKGE